MSVHTSKEFPWYKRWLFDIFREFAEARERAQDWTTKRCPDPKCQTPVLFEHANFCHICAAPLTPPIEPLAEPIPPYEPFERQVNTSAIHLPVVIPRRPGTQLIHEKHLAKVTNTATTGLPTPSRKQREIMRKAAYIERLVDRQTKKGKP